MKIYILMNPIGAIVAMCAHASTPRVVRASADTIGREVCRGRCHVFASLPARTNGTLRQPGQSSLKRQRRAPAQHGFGLRASDCPRDH